MKNKKLVAGGSPVTLKPPLGVEPLDPVIGATPQGEIVVATQDGTVKLAAQIKDNGSWCPRCEVMSRDEAELCGLCKCPVVLIGKEIVEKFLPLKSYFKFAIIKVPKADLVAEMI